MKIVGALLMMLAINHIIGCCWFGIGTGSLGPYMSKRIPEVHLRVILGNVCSGPWKNFGVWDG